MSTKEAFADATAGVAGSLVAMLAFYPMEVLKTNRQAGTSIASEHHETNTSKRDESSSSQTEEIKLRLKRIQNLFRGLHYKTAHTIASSFIYFFISSWIQSQHKHLLQVRYNQRRERGGIGDSKKFQYKPSTSMRLLLSAVAAMLNVVITLPLDVLAAQSQTRPRSSIASSESKNKTNGNDGRNDTFYRDLTQEEKKEEGQGSVRSQELWNSVLKPKSNNSAATTTNENQESPPDSRVSEVDALSMMDAVWHDAAERSQDIKMQDSFLSSKEEEEEEQIIGNTNSQEFGNVQNNEIATKILQMNQKEPNRTKPLFRIDTMTKPYPKEVLQSTTAPSNIQCKKSQSWQHPDHDRKPVKLKDYWRGIRPALLLCSNPSIHFTVFDIVKEWVFAHKRRRLEHAQQSSSTDIVALNLTMLESFILGMIAKFAATLATYPLIRAKVALMVSSRRAASIDGLKKQNPTMIGLLHDMFKKGGVKELYRGCNLQLIHTLLKSALLMMVREKIQEITRRLLLRD